MADGCPAVCSMAAAETGHRDLSSGDIWKPLSRRPSGKGSFTPHTLSTAKSRLLSGLWGQRTEGSPWTCLALESCEHIRHIGAEREWVRTLAVLCLTECGPGGEASAGVREVESPVPGWA